MMASASPEFIALCQSQVLLLTQALRATSTVVYLAEPSVNPVSPTLVPLVAYPDTAATWTSLNEILATMAGPDGALQADPQAGASNLLGTSEANPRPLASEPLPADQSPPKKPGDDVSPQADDTLDDTPLVLPIAHEGAILGVIVSTRPASPWSQAEYQQAERVANTLAIACVMDRRGQWLQRQFSQQQLTQANQSATFHDLLHQFRNPLTALQTFGKLMLKRMGTEDPNQTIAESIVRESRRLQDLAEHFDEAVAQGDEALHPPGAMPPVAGLLPSRPEDLTFPSGNTGTEADDLSHPLGRTLAVVPGSITDVIVPLVQSAMALLPDRDLELVQDIPPDLPDVWLDPQAMREVMSNLLDNAIKYALPRSLIWVTAGVVQTINGELYQGIAVGDTGAGIPLEDQPHIFERHYRGVQADSDIPGTGLGLAIVQDLVQAMGGHIEVISPVQIDHWVNPVPAELTQGPGTLFMVWLRTV